MARRHGAATFPLPCRIDRLPEFSRPGGLMV